MWAVVDEVSTRRPWKDHQKEYMVLAETKIQQRLDEAIAEVDSFTLEELTEELQVAKDSMTSATYTKAMAQYNSTLEELADVRREYQFAKSRGDEAYYFYKKSVREGAEDLDEKAKLEEHEADVEKYQAGITDLEAKRDSILSFLTTYRLRVRDVEKEISDLLEDVEKWQMKKRRIESAPIEIKQVMMLDYDRNPFNDPKARVDRCQTCHLGWNEDVMQEAPQPYTKHLGVYALSQGTGSSAYCRICPRR
jgi:chromosome segregation ATPase